MPDADPVPGLLVAIAAGDHECAAALADYLMERDDRRGHLLRARLVRWRRARAKALAARDEAIAPLAAHLNELAREVRRHGGSITWQVEETCYGAEREDALFRAYVRRLLSPEAGQG